MHTSVLFLLGLLFFTGCVTPPRTVFVAPNGCDTNEGTQAHPFASLPRAMDAVRKFRADESAIGSITVFLRGGTYPLRETIRFTPDDSGSADTPITYASYPGEEAILSGGEVLQGTWTRTPGKPYWQLEIPRSRDRQWIFYSLYVNGQSRERARTPNWGEKVFRAEGREPGGDTRQALCYFAGDVDPTWSNPTDIDVVLLCSWTPTIHRIQEIVPERRALRFFSAHTRAVDAWERHFRYYLSHVREALDIPGEWYHDRQQGILYYYPMPDEDLAHAEVIAPVLRSRMFTFESNPTDTRLITHLHFKNLSFRYLDGDMDKYNGQYRQGHMFLTAAVAANNLRHASFEGCTFSQLGEYAMELADGCRDVTVRHCHFYDLGAGALQLGVSSLSKLLQGFEIANPSSSASKIKQIPSWSDAQFLSNPFYVTDLTIDNCCIHRLGTIWHGCYGIVNRFASHTQITHNEIYDTHWDAIGLDARWDWQGQRYSHSNVVAYNHLHHLGLRYHTDAAGVYQFGPLDTHIHHNLVHDTYAYPYICGFAGLYLDQQSRGARVENNLVYNTEWFALFQNMGMDNLFSNNLTAFARDGMIGRGSLNATWKTNDFTVTHNVYISSNAVAIAKNWKDGERPPFLASNLYHSLSSEPLTFAEMPLNAWQALNRDHGSVITNSGCRAPAVFDFSLTSNAPACRLIGFVPFDTDIRQAGLYGDAEWRTLPSRYPARTPCAVWTEKDLKKLGHTFNLDFNSLSVGDQPLVFSQSKAGKSGFQVTDEVAGACGPHCLKVTDQKGLPKSFYPLLSVSPRGLTSGHVTFRFATRLPTTNAVGFILEMRGKEGPKTTGPVLAVLHDGRVLANRQPIGQLNPGEWTQVEITFDLGKKTTGQYTLTLYSATQKKQLVLPFLSAAFDQLSWLGFIAPSDADGCYYLDQITFNVDEETP